MKLTRRIPALLLAMAALCSLTLTGCKKEAPAPADQVALSIYDMIMKDDASSLVELFGYADEAEARRDMGLEGSIYDGMAEEMVSQISEMGITVSNEEMQAFINAYVSMFKEVEFTAKVKEADEKAGTAVVTCTISTFDPEAMTQAITDAMTNIDPSVLEGNDPDKIFSAMLSAMAEAISDLQPTGETADFDVDFELQKTEINGKTKEVWAPKDASEFGGLITSTAMGL